MRRTIAFVCVLVLVASLLAGCGGAKGDVAPAQNPGATVIKPGIAGAAPSSEKTAPAQEPENVPAAEPQSPASQTDGDYYMVYAQVPENWTEAYLWAWSQSEGDLFAAWPGEPMTHISGLWYGMDIPAEYDWVIVNDNGKNGEYYIQTEDIWTESKDAWVIFNDSESYLCNDTNTVAGYADKFENMGISDEKAVSDYLNTMSAIRKVETGLYMKLEYGFDSHGVKELACVYYYDLSGMSDAEISEGITNIRQNSQEMFGHLGFLEVRDDLRNEILVVTFHFRGLDDASNAREMVKALSELMESDTSGILDRNGNVVLDSLFALENSRFDVKLG